MFIKAFQSVLLSTTTKAPLGRWFSVREEYRHTFINEIKDVWKQDRYNIKTQKLDPYIEKKDSGDGEKFSTPPQFVEW
jgi:hypothetical protein